MSNLCQNKHVFKSNPDVLPLASLTKANGSLSNLILVSKLIFHSHYNQTIDFSLDVNINIETGAYYMIIVLLFV
jgi:hypothetical protein